MIQLKDILYKVTINAVVGSTSEDINTMHFDSRQVVKGDVFIAIRGTKVDGHQFINAVIKQGVRVGDNVIIGAGAVVLKDVNSNTTFVGNPAKQI